MITQEELREASEFQATAWMAEKQAREKVQDIHARLKIGATVEDGQLEFDPDLQMVRSKKQRDAG